MELYFLIPGFLTFPLVNNTKSFSRIKSPAHRSPALASSLPVPYVQMEGMGQLRPAWGREKSQGRGLAVATAAPREVPAYGQPGLAARAH